MEANVGEELASRGEYGLPAEGGQADGCLVRGEEYLNVGMDTDEELTLGYGDMAQLQATTLLEMASRHSSWDTTRLQKIA